MQVRNTQLSGGEIRFYTGDMPASPQDADTGDLLGSIPLATPAGTVAAVGTTVRFALTPAIGYASANGTIGHVRYVDSTGVAVMDADCGVPGSGAAVIIAPVSGAPTLNVYTGGELSTGVIELTE